jgi:cytoskeleton protein RodZ
MGLVLVKNNLDPIEPVQDNLAPNIPETVGLILQKARLKKGITLEKMADITKVRQVYLQALEENRTDELPAQVYALGFVRAVARALELNSDQLVVRYQQEIKAFNFEPSLEFPEPLVETSFPKKRLIGLSLIFAGGIVLWGLKHIEPAILEEPPVAVEVQSPPSSVAPIEEPLPPQEVKPLMMTPLPSIEQSFDTLKISKTPIAPQETPLAPVKIAPPKEVSYILKATSATWVRTTNSTGKILFEKTLKPGEIYTLPKDSGAFITMGNAGGVELHGSNTPPKVLGKIGEVRKAVPIEQLIKG